MRFPGLPFYLGVLSHPQHSLIIYFSDESFLIIRTRSPDNPVHPEVLLLRPYHPQIRC